MKRFWVKKSVLYVCMLFVLILTMYINTFASTPYIGCKQSFYYSNVIAYKWGNLTTSNNVWQQAFSSANNSWNSSQSKIAWGNVPTSYSTNNIMQVYYVENGTDTGRCQLSGYIGGYITMAWMELNQFYLANKSSDIKKSVAQHETGHGLGLNEYNTVQRTQSIMSQASAPINNPLGDMWTVLDTYKNPGSEDIAAINAIY